MIDRIRRHRSAGLVALLAVLLEMIHRLGLAGVSEAPRMLAAGLLLVALSMLVSGAAETGARRRSSRSGS